MPKRGITKFQQSWNTEFPWVKPVEKDPYQARCELCGKNFAIDSMGRQAVVSHSISKKHKEIFLATTSNATPLPVFFKQNLPHPEPKVSSASASTTKSAESTDQPESHASSTGQSVCTAASCTQKRSYTVFPTLQERVMNNYLIKEATTKREAIWCMGTVMNHDSLRNSQEKVALFKYMFNEVDEVQQLELSKAKISYVIVYGLGPFFRIQLDDIAKSCDYYVFGFDESLNKVAQKQQMDVILRFWDKTRNEVSTRYLTSVFLEHTTSEDLLKAFKEAIQSFNFKKILQLSMDGPNVNFKFLRLFKEDIKNEKDDPELLDIGSCGIHTTHCAFKAGMRGTGWEIIEFLRAIYNLFKNVPSRRGDYIRITNTTEFPLKFCAIRWLENAKVAIRAQSILPHMKVYVEKIRAEKRAPKCKSFEVIERLVQDKLLPAKLVFFRSIAEHVEPFLREYQTDSPMAPFLSDSLTLMLRNMIERLVKSEILNTIPLVRIDLTKKENLQRTQDFDLGYATRDALRQCKNIKDIDVLQFRKDCMTCLRLFAEKIVERSPLKYPFTMALSCLNPTTIASSTGAMKPLKSALEILVQGNRLSGNTADKVEREFRVFCERDSVKDAMKNYIRTDERLDHFWVKMLGNNKENENLTQFIKMLLILSHGNASVERGFSVNKECLVENLREQSLIAQRHVYDAVSTAGGIRNVSITTPLIHAVKNAHARYKEALLQRATEDEIQKNKNEAKKRAIQERKELSAKKIKILKEIDDKRTELKQIENQVKSLH